MFLLNSCLSLFSAAWFPRHPFSRSYRVILPSSLTMLLPPALGFSPHPPVSVYGTGTSNTIAAFLDTSSTCFATLVRSTSRPRVDRRFFLSVLCCACTGLSFSGSCFPTLFRSASRLRIATRICLHGYCPACTGLSIPGMCCPSVSPQF